MTSETKARASEMLAGLRLDRFSLVKEADLRDLGIPFDLRRSTQDDVLREKAERPIFVRQTPPISEAAYFYWTQRDCWCRESKACQTTALSIGQKTIGQLLAKQDAHQRDRFSPPITEDERILIGRYRSVIDQIKSHRDICARLWAEVPALDKLRFYDPKPTLAWACDYPTLAVNRRTLDHTYAWWPEGIPEYRRQIKLLEWVLEQD